jgi:Carboxypeptidase regulatory-like domain
MKSSRLVLGILIVLTFCAAGWAQTTGSITGTVKDPSGAAIAGATVVVASPERGINREMATNSTGDYNQSGLPAGNYDIGVTASGFKKYQAKGVKLDVAEKARVDVTLQVGTTSTEVVVEGTAVAQVETQSSDLSGVVTGKQITQLELNNRNYTSLVTLVPGVSSAPDAPDEAAVGISNIFYTINGGRTEYNNWELDGGDNMDNGSNNTLNVYPSLDAIAEFKVLTSNYGAQYGRNGSGTIEVETKSGTKQFHGNAYEFVRNDFFNAQNYFDDPSHGGTGETTPYKKNDFGYTIGGPVTIPHVYNTNKEKTFFFWSQEWRRERAPQTFNTVVPYSAERAGDFSDLCPNVNNPSDPFGDCPIDPRTGSFFDGSQGPLPIDPVAAALLPMIPVGTVDAPGASAYVANSTLPTSWREELFKIDHNLTSHNRVTFRYIHDSWNTVQGTPIWTGSSFPTSQTFFNGPGVSMVARLTSTISPTLLNEFVASYTTDHISFKTQGVYQRPDGLPMGSLFNNGFGGKLPAITLSGGIYDGIFQDPGGLWPEGAYNSNPTYTYRDNMTKILGRHNLQFGAYLATAQKNELSSLQVNGSLTFDTASPLTTGNALADMLMGNISNFTQGSNQIKFYNRYKIVEPYFQDDWRITDRLTLNLGLRISLFGTYRDRYKRTYNWDPAAYSAAEAPQIDVDGSITGAAGALVPGVGNPYDGLVQCGVGGVPVGCSSGHLFNPAPRLGFAWDPWGDGRTAIRGGYGIFFEHTNGNEANTEGMEGQSTPLIQTASQDNIAGYPNIGGGSLSPSFPFSFTSIPKKVTWPYMQQWHLDVQRELPSHIVTTLSYVGSKGTHLGRQRDLNQLFPTPASANPYQPGQPITTADCDLITDAGFPDVSGVVNGQPVTGQVAINLQTACGNSADPYRPFYGLHNITRLESAASSIYHALQFSGRKTIGSLNLSVAYTYSHSIDDSSDRYNGDFVNSYDPSAARATSTFDRRHVLNVSYVYDLPFFKKPGITHSMLGGWQWSGIVAYSTGAPLNITNGTDIGDNAGVGNGVGTGSYPDLVGNPRANVPPPSQVTGPQYAGYFYNPAAYAAPTGLTFGNVGRNSLAGPSRTNFDMALFKHFAIRESTAFEFRFEAFNVFNHTQWNPPGSTALGNSDFFEINSAHLSRILQLGAKFIF